VNATDLSFKTSAVHLTSPPTRHVTLRQLADTITLHLFSTTQKAMRTWPIDMPYIAGYAQPNLAEGLAAALAKVPHDSPLIEAFLAKCGADLRERIEELLPIARGIVAAQPNVGRRGGALNRTAAE
jgi:hypothetical protein